eukprot:7243822-Prymnesium_polylepis.1
MRKAVRRAPVTAHTGPVGHALSHNERSKNLRLPLYRVTSGCASRRLAAPSRRVCAGLRTASATSSG